MKKLHAVFGDRVHFLDVFVRQAHPGDLSPSYTEISRKMSDAHSFQEEHQIPWPVLVDDLHGRVHQAYGSLPDPTYLIDSRGRISFYNLWSGATVLHRASTHLLEKGGVGVVDGGISLMPHPLAALTAGWPALERGGSGSAADLRRAAPGLPELMWAGYHVRPLLAPLALRAAPLPKWVKLTMVAAAVAVGVAWVRRRS